MSKIVLLLAIACVWVLQVQAQNTAANRLICANLHKRCLSLQRQVGQYDEVTNYFNANCLKENRTWQKITHCQLERSACRLNLLKCGALTCRNVSIEIDMDD